MNNPTNAYMITHIFEVANVGKGVLPILTDLDCILFADFTKGTPGLQEVVNENGLVSRLLIYSRNWYDLIYIHSQNNNAGISIQGYSATPSDSVLDVGVFAFGEPESVFHWYLGRTVFSDTLNNKGLEYDDDYSENFTEHSLVSKLYVDKRTVTNETTTALSISELSITYPEANAGFRVQCINIAAGGLIYEKTETGWVQYSIQIVL